MTTQAWHSAAGALLEGRGAVPYASAQEPLSVDGAPRSAGALDADGTARAVPWARHAWSPGVLRSDGGRRAAGVPPAEVKLRPGQNGKPRDHVEVATDPLTGVMVADEATTEFGSTRHWDDRLADAAPTGGAGRARAPLTAVAE